MVQKLNWRAYTSKNRLEVLEEIKRIVMTSSGYIVHFQAFSDLALSLAIQIEERDIADLLQTLRSVVEIEATEIDQPDPTSETEWLIFLNLSFAKGMGRLETLIPEVPG